MELEQKEIHLRFRLSLVFTYCSSQLKTSDLGNVC